MCLSITPIRFLDLGGIVVEDDVLIRPKDSIITESHPVNPNERKKVFKNRQY